MSKTMMVVVVQGSSVLMEEPPLTQCGMPIEFPLEPDSLQPITKATPKLVEVEDKKRDLVPHSRIYIEMMVVIPLITCVDTPTIQVLMVDCTQEHDDDKA